MAQWSPFAAGPFLEDCANLLNKLNYLKFGNYPFISCSWEAIPFKRVINAMIVYDHFFAFRCIFSFEHIYVISTHVCSMFGWFVQTKMAWAKGQHRHSSSKHVNHTPKYLEQHHTWAWTLIARLEGVREGVQQKFETFISTFHSSPVNFLVKIR